MPDRVCFSGREMGALGSDEVTTVASLTGLLLLTLLAKWKPEAVLAVTAIVIPSGEFHPSLRVSAPPFGQLSIIEITTLSSALACVAFTPGLLRRGVRSPSGLLGVAFCVAGLLAAIGSGNGRHSFYWIANLGIFVIASSCLLVDRVRYHRESVEFWLCVCGAILAASVLVEMAVGHRLSWGTGTLEIAASVGTFRPVGLSGNPLVTAAELAAVSGITLFGSLRGSARLFLCTLFFGAIIATGARSAALAVAIGLPLYIIYGKGPATRSRMLRRLGASAAAILLAVAIAQPFSGFASRIGDNTVVGASDATRGANLHMAWNQFSLHPVWGLGYGGFKDYAITVYGSESLAATADNAYLSLATDVGLVGLTILCSVFTASILFSYRRRIANGTVMSLAAFAPIGIVSGFFDAEYYNGMAVLSVAVILMCTVPYARQAPRIRRPQARGCKWPCSEIAPPRSRTMPSRAHARAGPSWGHYREESGVCASQPP